MRVATNMHPYRGGPQVTHDDDADVRAFAQSARLLQRFSMVAALIIAIAASIAIVDWPLGGYVLSGAFLSRM